MTSDCIFCKIIAGEAPAITVFEDEWTLAFLDINPINPGHTLIIPKQHHQDLFSMTSEAYQQLAATTLIVAQAVHAHVKADGLNVFQANGVAAGQTVFHLHNHVLPRHQPDRLRVNLAEQPVQVPGQDEPLEKIAASIRLLLN